MDSPGPKQRSPWLYALLGCGGAVVLGCLGVFGAGAYCTKKVSDIGQGVLDPKKREENATRILGGTLPPGYFVAAGVDVFFMQMAVLTDTPPDPDAGIMVKSRMFRFMHVVANDSSKRAKEIFTKTDADPIAVAQSNMRFDPESVVKRGTLTIGDRSFPYLVVAGRFDVGNDSQPLDGPLLNTAILFQCSDALDLGVWTQRSAVPEGTKAADVDVTGTVGDEAELAGFLKSFDPCKAK
jgi:hypothetical protein